MTSCKIFYSWQSDLENRTNRTFIEEALKKAAKSICDDDSLKVEPVIDRDTTGVPGAPDIASTIFNKIEKAQVFVCDISIINQGIARRPTPNPNVLIELGYAVKALGTERIIMVMNTAFGELELLPFDLRMRRVIPYNMPMVTEERATERKQLEKKLITGLKAIFSGQSTQIVSEITGDLTGNLGVEELELLTHALEIGGLHLQQSLRSKWVRAGQKDFMDSEDLAYAARYCDALDVLLEKKLVKYDRGIWYPLTGRGFEIARKQQLS